MKKFLILLISLLMCFSIFSGCSQQTTPTDNTGDNGGVIENPDDIEKPGENENPDDNNKDEEVVPDWLENSSASIKANLSADGYVKGNIIDFSIYKGTNAYRKVSNADELVAAVKDAVWHYKTIWNESNSTITHVPADGYNEENFRGTVHVIEITQDIDLGYNMLSDTAKSSGVIDNNIKISTINDGNGNKIPAYTMSSMVEEHGMSVLKFQNMNDLLVYSKNGAKITHATMKVMSASNIAFRNLEFDEVWQWEDSQSYSASKVGDYDSQKWAYFKIDHCGYVWIDHCTFGKASDGLIDYANPAYSDTQLMANLNRTPYGLRDERGVHISWCNFKGGSDDKDGYIYKMMEEIEKNYQDNLADGSVVCKYLYYKALRDAGCSFENILYGLAIPQKKAFLCGDSGDNKQDYYFNRKIKISIANCYFKNIEDRIPKLRGGNGYFYNNVVDNLQYYSYRNKLSAYVSAVTRLGWKCALVSQCMLVSNGASLMAENCIFRGIQTLIKNNDKAITVDGVSANIGYYKLINCMYQQSETSKVIKGSTTDEPNPFAASGIAYTDGFSWHATDGELPFETNPILLVRLENTLNDENFGVGTRAAMGEICLRVNY